MSLYWLHFASLGSKDSGDSLVRESPNHDDRRAAALCRNEYGLNIDERKSRFV